MKASETAGRGLHRRALAALGSAAFLVVAPGMVAGLVPWWLTGWRFGTPLGWWDAVRVPGLVLTIAATAILVSAFARFVVEGVGTPAPVAPTQHLVVGGVYCFVRNPMYIAVVGAIVGQALFLGQLILLEYAAAVGVLMMAFAHWVEEPILLERFGAEYQEYRRAVPGWWPRLGP
jgi:protein-S-isoprenylcysteine O-methyltransferase Ste14